MRWRLCSDAYGSALHGRLEKILLQPERLKAPKAKAVRQPRRRKPQPNLLRPKTATVDSNPSVSSEVRIAPNETLLVFQPAIRPSSHALVRLQRGVFVQTGAPLPSEYRRHISPNETVCSLCGSTSCPFMRIVGEPGNLSDCAVAASRTRTSLTGVRRFSARQRCT